MNKLLYIFPLVVLVAAGCGSVQQNVGEPKVCTQEAMQCPDGSYVGRTGPNCSFAACPTPTPSGTLPSVSDPTPSLTPSKKGTVQGQVLLGPTCPVERIPPDPACAPKPYQTTIRVQFANPSAPYQTVTSNDSGTFSVSLDPGTYTFQAQGGNSSYPICHDIQVKIVSGQTQTINLSCDTGIR